MPHQPDPSPPPSDHLSEIVRRAMIEAAELKDIEERVTEVAGRISKITPRPERTTPDPGDPPPS